MKKEDARFEVVYKEGTDFNESGIKQILVDKKTGVNYLFVKSGYGAGLTPLLDSDGNAVVTGK